jgi:hypothetical protein
MSIMAGPSTALAFYNLSENTASRQSSPGILVFSRSLQLQYVNRRALELMTNIRQTARGSGSIVLPASLLELRALVQKILNDNIGTNTWEPFEVAPVVGKFGQGVLLRGFGQPNRASRNCSRIIIILEDIRFAEKGRRQQSHILTKRPESQTAVAGLLVSRLKARSGPFAAN